LNQANRKKISAAKVLSAGFFLDRDPGIPRIVEEKSPTYEPKSGVFFEAVYNRREEVIGRMKALFMVLGFPLRKAYK
jgi:hypothetical protein